MNTGTQTPLLAMRGIVKTFGGAQRCAASILISRAGKSTRCLARTGRASRP